ncbi:Transmembrane protein 183 [Exaiptasia diaphana]|nr:Transmembrane protein 183 [Exaiptasia diaphana]
MPLVLIKVNLAPDDFTDFAVPHATNDSDLLWFERDDFEIERSTGDDDDDDDDTANDPIIDDKKKNKKVHKQPKGFSGENIYPEDLWHILSIFIRPEEVLSFALICKGSLNAVSSIRFWLRLYNVYVQDQEKLPSSLRPDRFDCGPGLRSRVVRALFCDFNTFKSRLVRKLTIVHSEIQKKTGNEGKILHSSKTEPHHMKEHTTISVLVKF